MSEKIDFGVDVCKENLAFCGAGIAGQVANNAPGVRRLSAGLPKEAHLMIEASGGYERELVRMAQESAVPVSVALTPGSCAILLGVGGWPRAIPLMQRCGALWCRGKSAHRCRAHCRRAGAAGVARRPSAAD